MWMNALSAYDEGENVLKDDIYIYKISLSLSNRAEIIC